MEKIKNLNSDLVGVNSDNVIRSIDINPVNIKKDKNISQVIHFKYKDFLDLDNFCKEMM